MQNDILFIGGTHGDEPIGVEVLERLKKVASGFDWIIGSPPALQAGSREFEGNLNRSAPGNPEAPEFASRRAAEILKLAEKYRYVIDLHGTKAYTGIFIIITNPSRANLELALKLDITNIVLWPSFSSELQGPLSEFFPCGLEIECGPKDMPLIKVKLEAILSKFLAEADAQVAPEGFEAIAERRKVYEVYGSLKSGADPTELTEFVPTRISGETFVPLLVGRYQERDGIICYKMCPIDDPLHRFSE